MPQKKEKKMNTHHIIVWGGVGVVEGKLKNTGDIGGGESALIEEADIIE